ncbi:MAG: D-alanyl-D-alanine carboxypeptidase, partial [Bacteroidota bacterium]|nr:D-alanyl-D-alanine carboxypeptidase [Bacteroidota bacterium]
AYIYLAPNSTEGYVRGTIPVGENNFIISGAMSNPGKEFCFSFQKKLSVLTPKSPLGKTSFYNIMVNEKKVMINPVKIYTHYSPPLDSIIYWFLKKSINLYGEALVKTIAYGKQGFGRTDSGVAIIKNFWKQKGIDPEELNIYDGSGLSPLNRVTTHAQVKVLKYAKEQTWFSSFYNSLPEFNGMKMKSGTISDVKGFAGFQTAKDGTEFIFSFLVNNYNGSTSLLVQKMYKVLDVLK